MNAEIAMVLDVSGSMLASMGTDSRINVLKQAAHDLVNTVSAGANGSKPAKFGIVPFTMNVNIGTDNAQYVQGTNHALFNGTSWAGCVFERSTPNHINDVYDGADNSPEGKWHAYIWPPEPDTNGQCINPSDGTNAGYASIVENPAGVYLPQTAGPNFNCVRHPIMRLSEDTTAVHAKIDELTSEWQPGHHRRPRRHLGHAACCPPKNRLPKVESTTRIPARSSSC